jgi:hypothetical protein
MAVTAEDFLRLAEDLLTKPAPTEIDFRTAAARAYYAVMHLVRAELNLNGADLTHTAIRRELLSLSPITTPRFLAEAKWEWDGLWDRRHRIRLPGRAGDHARAGTRQRSGGPQDIWPAVSGAGVRRPHTSRSPSTK